MNTPTKPFRLLLRALLLGGTVLLLINPTLLAGSATWNLNPVSSDWNTAANWTPATVPNAPADVATFDVSNFAAIITLSAETQIGEIVFNPGASSFSIDASNTGTLTISGTGITNNSGIVQNFFASNSDASFNQQSLEFRGNASAGTNTNITNAGNATFGVTGGWTYFRDQSDADHATFVNYGGAAGGPISNGRLFFYNFSTASQAHITNQCGIARGAAGGLLDFVDHATAANATIVNIGGPGGLNGGNGGSPSSTGARPPLMLP